MSVYAVIPPVELQFNPSDRQLGQAQLLLLVSHGKTKVSKFIIFDGHLSRAARTALGFDCGTNYPPAATPTTSRSMQQLTIECGYTSSGWRKNAAGFVSSGAGCGRWEKVGSHAALRSFVDMWCEDKKPGLASSEVPVRGLQGTTEARQQQQQQQQHGCGPSTSSEVASYSPSSSGRPAVLEYTVEEVEHARTAAQLNPLGGSAQGGFGVVFKATLDGAGAVVVKMFHGLAAVGEVRDGTARGYQLVTQNLVVALQMRHAHLPVLRGVVRNTDSGDVVGLVFDQCSTTLELGTRMRKTDSSHGWTFAQKCRILADVALACLHLHRRMLVHRDIKPSNILVNSHGRGVLADFDLVTFVGTVGQAGTSGFIPPECCGPEALQTFLFDVYSLGACAVFILDGGRNTYKLFPSPALPKTKAKPPSVSELVGLAVKAHRLAADGERKKYEALSLLAFNALQRDPSKRPQLKSVVAQLEQLLADDGVTAS